MMISIKSAILYGLGIIVFIFIIFVQDFGSSDGTHVGQITAVEHNSNIIFPSDNLYFKSDAQSSQEDEYCIRQELMDQAREFARNKTKVEVHFKNDFIMWSADCNGGISIIVDIKEVVDEDG